MVIPTFIAHRGIPSEAPENTLLSFQKAHEKGATWVECDVMLTQDKQPIIMHDETLNRTTNGQGRVADHTFAEIAQLDAGQGQKVPSLSDFLNLAATLNLGINLEIKEHTQNACIIADKIFTALQTYWPVDLKKPLISSANPACLIAYRTRDANAYLAYIVDTWPFRCLHQLKKLSASILVINYKALNQRRVARLHHKGYRVFAYTVNDPLDKQRLLDFGVDSLFTDNIGL